MTTMAGLLGILINDGVFVVILGAAVTGLISWAAWMMTKVIELAREQALSAEATKTTAVLIGLLEDRVVRLEGYHDGRKSG